MKFKSSGTSRRTSRQTQGKSLSVHAETCELRTLLTASVTSVGIVDSLELPLDAGDREVTSDTDSTPASCEVVDEPITCIFPDWDGAVADFESVAVEDGDLLGDSGSSEFVDGEGLLLPGTGGLDPIPSWCYRSFVTTMDGETDGEVEVTDEGKDTTHVDFDLSAYYEALFASIFATTWDGEVSEGEFSEADPADFESVTVDDGDLLGDSGSSESVDGEGLLLPGTGGLDPIPSWCYRSFVTTMDGETDGEVEVTDEGKDTTHVDFDLSAYYEALFASIFATTWDGEVSEGEFSEADPADFESVAVEDQAIFEDLESIADLESGDIWDRSVMFLSANAGGVEVQRSNVSSEVMTATTAASTLAIPVKPQSSTALFSSDRDRSPMSIPAVAQATSVLGSHASLGKRNATLRRLSAQLTATRQIPAAEGLSNLSPILGGDVAPSETESPENSVDSPPVEAGSSEETVSENGSSTAAGFAANQYVQTGSRRAATIDRVMAQYAEHLFNS